jgi:isopenicillin-N N-acyltransferase like protein
MADLKVIDCVGDGRNRGRAHGEAARLLVRAALARWEETVGAKTGLPVEHYVSGFLGSTRVHLAMQDMLPDIAAEIDGIAEGAGVSHDVLAAYNLMDEQWWYDLESERGCSVLAVA